MSRFYSPEECRRKADQHWELAGLARQDNDQKDAKIQTDKAMMWEARASNGGYEGG